MTTPGDKDKPRPEGLRVSTRLDDGPGSKPEPEPAMRREGDEPPFVIGVMGDFSGRPDSGRPPPRDRAFLPVDHIHLDDAMRRVEPGLSIRVENMLTGEGEIPVQLEFRSLDDFEPDKVAAQVEPLRRLVEARGRLLKQLDKGGPPEDLERLVQDILKDGGAGHESSRS